MTSTRAIREFARVGDPWPTIERWMSEHRYRLIESERAGRIYRKGRGWLGQMRVLSILCVGDLVHLEAWLAKPRLLDEYHGLKVPDEITIEPGAWFGSWPRSRARKEVNGLLERLGAPPIVDAIDPDDELADRIGAGIDEATECGRRGDFARALEIWERTIPLMERRMGTMSGMTLTARLDMADVMMECGREPEALVLLERLVPDLETVVGPDETWTHNAKEALGVALVATGRAEEGYARLEALVEELERAAGQDLAITGRIRKRLAQREGGSVSAP